MLFEREQEAIRQDQTRDALEQIKVIIMEAATQLATGDYVTTDEGCRQ